MKLSAEIGLLLAGLSIAMGIRDERQETGERVLRIGKKRRKKPFDLFLDSFLPRYRQAMATPGAAGQFGGD